MLARINYTTGESLMLTKETILDKYIDDCVCAKIPSATIIHGFGTGTIRKLVWDYLKNNKFVKEYRYGGEGEGLNGATVVYFK